MNRLATIRKRVARSAATSDDAKYLLQQVDVLRDQILAMRRLESELSGILWAPLAAGEPPLRHPSDRPA